MLSSMKEVSSRCHHDRNRDLNEVSCTGQSLQPSGSAQVHSYCHSSSSLLEGQANHLHNNKQVLSSDSGAHVLLARHRQ